MPTRKKESKKSTDTATYPKDVESDKAVSSTTAEDSKEQPKEEKKKVHIAKVSSKAPITFMFSSAEDSDVPAPIRVVPGQKLELSDSSFNNQQLKTYRKHKLLTFVTELI